MSKSGPCTLVTGIFETFALNSLACKICIKYYLQSGSYWLRINDLKQTDLNTDMNMVKKKIFFWTFAREPSGRE